MDIVQKAAPVEDIGDGQFHILLSTADTDRDGENLHLDQWKTPLPQHIPISADHDMSTNGVIGSGRPELTAQGLEVHGRWADTERARNVRELVKAGHLTSVSVEFIRHSDKSGTVSRELIGGSFVHTPSNPHARVLSAKGLDEFAMKLDAVLKAGNPDDTEQRLVQTIHNASTMLGAQCNSGQSEPSPDMEDGSAEGANRSLEAAVEMKARLLRMRLG